MSTIKSSDEHLTLNADGSSKDIKFQANGVEKASISSSGAFTSTTIDATKLTGTIPNFTSTGIDDNADATAITIDSNEKIGIGTTSPAQKLHVEDTAATNTSTYISVVSGTGGNAGITFGDSDADLVGGVLFNNADNALRFFKNGFTEAMRVDSSGRLLVNRTSANATEQVQINHTGSSQYGMYINSTSGGTGTQYHMSWARENTQCGYMTSSPTSIGLNNASDERLKENIQDSASATQDIKNIKVRQFDWKDNKDAHKDYGFVAQELLTVVPEAVAVGSDELNEDGTPVQIWGVDDSKLIPRLVKTIQELEARITALEA